MTEILIAIISFIIGGALVWIYLNSKINKLNIQNGILETKVVEDVEKAKQIAQIEIENLKNIKHQSDLSNRDTIELQRKNAQEIIDNLKQQLNEERLNSEKLRKESDAQWQLKLDALKKEILQAASDNLINSGEKLRMSNTESIDTLLRPIKEQFEAFKKSVDDNSIQNAVNKKEIQEKFDLTLKSFILEQTNAIDRIKDQTVKIGNDAVALAQALKSNNKKLGNWGEMILQNLLENSGLEKDKHYFVQYNSVNDEGKRNIPDVLVKFPEGRSVIIDSKVSLTSYTQYFETDDEQTKESLLKAHVSSVLRHIDELSAKNYPKSIENSLDYVLMFIPNESSYVAAMQYNPDLLHIAYNKNIIIVSPNNMMMALYLVYNMWQNDKQIKNVEKIVDRGKQLYEKVYNFKSSFESVGEAIVKLQNTYSKASAQIYTGPGNILRQCNMLMELGIQPDKNKVIKSPDIES